MSAGTCAEERHAENLQIPVSGLLYQILILETHLMGRIRPSGRKAVRRDAKAQSWSNGGKQPDALRRADTPHRRPRNEARWPRCVSLVVLGTPHLGAGAQPAPNQRASFRGEMSLQYQDLV